MGERTGDARRLLSVYLSDHRAGSSGGLALVARARRSNEGSELGTYLRTLETELIDERAQLEVIAASLGVRLGRWKTVIGRVAVEMGRLKPNGRLVGYSPLSRVLELEALIAGVTTKKRLWRSLLVAAPTDAIVDATELDRLTAQADEQLEHLMAHHREAAALAF